MSPREAGMGLAGGAGGAERDAHSRGPGAALALAPVVMVSNLRVGSGDKGDDPRAVVDPGHTGPAGHFLEVMPPCV